jgi:hypothetical protein
MKAVIICPQLVVIDQFSTEAKGITENVLYFLISP